jgi:hypothetical protein
MDRSSAYQIDHIINIRHLVIIKYASARILVETTHGASLHYFSRLCLLDISRNYYALPTILVETRNFASLHIFHAYVY